MDLKGILQELAEFDTALLANTIEYIDPTPPEAYYLAGTIQSVTPGLGPTVGVAVTCEIDTSTPGGTADMSLYWQQVEEITAMDLPVVWVVKTVGARPEHECVLGDGMAKVLHAAGCVGVVTDGGVRDISGLLSTPLAVYSRGCTVHHAALRMRAINRPVEVGGITVSPGDVVHANEEGVITIPRACLPILPARAAVMRLAEHEVHRIWRRTDISLADKRAHVLQVFTQHGFLAAHGGAGHELEGEK